MKFIRRLSSVGAGAGVRVRVRENSFHRGSFSLISISPVKLFKKDKFPLVVPSGNCILPANVQGVKRYFHSNPGKMLEKQSIPATCQIQIEWTK